MLPALHLPTGAKEEAPEASGEITMQQRLLVRVIDATAGLRPEANAHQLLLGLGNSVPPASAENPGEDLGNAAILARLGSVEGSKDSAIARLDALQKSISDGKAQATPEFLTLLGDVRAAVLATKAPGPGEVGADAAHRIEAALGDVGTGLVAQANGDAEGLAALANRATPALIALLLFIVLALVLGLVGLAVLATFVVQVLRGRTNGAGPSAREWSPVYAEMFAVWMGLYWCLNRLPDIAMDFLQSRGIVESGWHSALGLNGALALSVAISVVAALAAIWWGVRRGLSWPTIRSGIALTRFRGSDLAWGFLCYCMGIALLAVGVVVSAVLTALFGSGASQPSHPIQQVIEQAGPLGLGLTFVIASVCAPIFEEMFFRGALYRNLEDMCSGAGRLAAVVVATVVSSVLFAAIHPQGLLFVPVLGSLAVAFCLMREWRGSINAGIVAHALNNGVILLLNVMLLR
ncbi:MAG: type II CAAX endopeptidase family protein [Phycisphaerales bacterium]